MKLRDLAGKRVSRRHTDSECDSSRIGVLECVPSLLGAGRETHLVYARLASTDASGTVAEFDR